MSLYIININIFGDYLHNNIIFFKILKSKNIERVDDKNQIIQLKTNVGRAFRNRHN